MRGAYLNLRVRRWTDTSRSGRRTMGGFGHQPTVSATARPSREQSSLSGAASGSTGKVLVEDMEGHIVSPGEEIQPQIDLSGAVLLAEKLFGIKVDAAKELDGYDDKNYHLQVSQYPDNEFMADLWPHGYVLKIMNSSDSKKLDCVDGQCQIMVHLDKNGIKTPQPRRNIDGKIYSLEKLHGDGRGDQSGREHVVRLLTYQEGTLMKHVPWSFDLHYSVGRYSAQLDLVLKDFSHPASTKYSSLWCLKNSPLITDYLFVIEDQDKLSLVKEVIESFKKCVLETYNTLKSGIIHGDIHDQNLLCQKDIRGEWYISAVLDLGDSHHSAYVLELALAMTYMMLQSEMVESGGHVLVGYYSLHPLPLVELKLLKVSVCARLCQSLVLGLYTHSLHPTNEYVLTTQAPGWKLLNTLWSMDSASLDEIWLSGLAPAQNQTLSSTI